MREPVPAPVQRLPKQTLHHAWAPKLQRPVKFASVTQVHLWVMLEANPSVTTYCERPVLSVEPATQPIADFWVMRDGAEQWLMVDDNVDEARVHDPHLASQATQAVSNVETISCKDIEHHCIWIQNWMSLLPYLATGSRLIDQALLANVIQFFDRPTTIDEAEQHFSRIDPVLVRTAIIAGLHGGQLISPDLTTLAFSRYIRVSRYRHGETHEAE
ncbi:hypothetical protein ACVCIH_20415 [Burkholderia glumae]|uniref:hypothetical protein n=1 Tax=Burkholderia TaxID=32008 RepID=UPI0020367709|nr:MULTISPECIES: hypothetical protein [Burkholderia]MCM2496218.1 hypothetical protein [Burkholderia glumae]